MRSDESMIGQCEWCGDSFLMKGNGRPRKFCGNTCRVRRQRGERWILANYEELKAQAGLKGVSKEDVAEGVSIIARYLVEQKSLPMSERSRLMRILVKGGELL